jgi:phenylacetate-CoA ligase
MTTATIAVEQRRAARHARLRAALPDHLERRTWDAARIRAHQRDRLRALLRHAKARSPFLAIVELVDERNRSVPPGTASAKVLVTNLMNPTQPLIRYELTDRFVQQPDAAEHGHLRVTVEGRADELLGYGGVVVHPLVLRSVLVDTPEVVEYQVTQTHRGAHVAVVAPRGVDEPALAARLAAALGGVGVGAAEVTVESVPAIARHPDTGKARRFIPQPAAAP